MQIDIEPCLNLIPDKVELKDIKECLDHLNDEVKEVTDALVDYSVQKDGKSREALAEELVDVMTMALTSLMALERTKDSPEHLSFAAMQKVLYKNYGRGYYDNNEG